MARSGLHAGRFRGSLQAGLDPGPTVPFSGNYRRHPVRFEIFVDADYSGGDHQYNHNAFAYHFSLDNRAIDIGTDRKARDYSHHVESRWRQEGNKVIWEVAIDVYDDTYDDHSSDNEPLTLGAGMVLGLMAAYCDNDGSELRENFIGSESVPTGPKDRGWIDAGLFGKVVLHE